MRGALVTYFDIGYSLGLNDGAFTASPNAYVASLGKVGLLDPLGEGRRIWPHEGSTSPDGNEDTAAGRAALLSTWRHEAVRQVDREDMELGWHEEWSELTLEAFKAELKRLIGSHPVRALELTVHAIGVAYLRLEFADGMDARYVRGFLACFEFAGYLTSICQPLLALAREAAQAAVSDDRSELQLLTRRPEAAVNHDAEEYVESTLIRSFTHLVVLSPGEGPGLRDQMLQAFDVEKAQAIEFEYHGVVHYNWATCVVTPRRTRPGVNGDPDPEHELDRIWQCVHIAHVALAACEAFLALAEAEIDAQVGGYVAGNPAGRHPQELNRLRTLALAVVNLTDVDRVTATLEDLTYLRAFQSDAGMAKTRTLLTEAIAVLYQVQDAEVQQRRAGREQILNRILSLLAVLTLISVSNDAYTFIRGGDPDIFTPEVERLTVVVEFTLALFLVGALVLWLTDPDRARQPRLLAGPLNRLRKRARGAPPG